MHYCLNLKSTKAVYNHFKVIIICLLLDSDYYNYVYKGRYLPFGEKLKEVMRNELTVIVQEEQ